MAPSVASRWGEQGTVDLKHELEQVLMLTASRCLLGKEMGESVPGKLCEVFSELDNGLHLISGLLPYLPIPAHRRRDRARQRLGEIITEVIRSRRNSSRAAGIDENDDMLQRLIDSRYKDGRAMTDAEVAGLIVALMFAGKHTSSGEMRTLHCCIKEVLWLHPPVAAVRQAYNHFTVQTKEGKECTIPGGHMVVSTILVNHYLPHVYKDPHVFDPQRFAPGREEDKAAGRFSSLSFSAGRHACAGESFSYTQIKVLWSYLLSNFELKMVSPFPETEWSTVIPEPKGKLMVSYRRRHLNSK
uniref:Cytochrome P450 n=1 Tax=Oryza punctata TaxID=4537 RepID=A0A0E0LKB1_ORYPU